MGGRGGVWIAGVWRFWGFWGFWVVRRIDRFGFVLFFVGNVADPKEAQNHISFPRPNLAVSFSLTFPFQFHFS